MNTATRHRSSLGLQEFLDSPLNELLEPKDTQNLTAGVVDLFHETANRVPAYARFLAEHGVDPGCIQSLEDFHRLPLATKQNYLDQRPLNELCRDGQLNTCDFVAVSSGSTGTPHYWPRSLRDEVLTAIRFEQVFHDAFQARRRNTLAVVCFALGTWVGGMFTASCLRHLAAKHYPLTVVTPGNNKEEIFRVMTGLAPYFEQTVLLGYPPFIKDVIDSGLARDVPWDQYSLRLVFAGEVFSEEWRSLVCQRIGAQNPALITASLYGTADAGVLGNETPVSIEIRRFLAQRPDAAKSLFGQSRLPTLVQYDPTTRYFEETEGTLLFSGDNGIPLIRYHISDEGGLIPYKTMMNRLADMGMNTSDITAVAIGAPIRDLPFAYVFGRSHFVVSYFGANIYPENISVGLEQPEIRQWVTGKFVLEITEDPDKNRWMHIVVELAPGETASPERIQAAAQSIHRQLLRLNSEFANYVPAHYQTPQIELRAFGDPEWFPIGVKHRYTRSRPI
jgi:phenylacetate-CoA ligase